VIISVNMPTTKPSPLESFVNGPATNLLLLIVSVLGPIVASATKLTRPIKEDPGEAVVTGVIIFLICEALKLSLQMSFMRVAAYTIEEELNRVASVLPKTKQSSVTLSLQHLSEVLESRNDRVGTCGTQTLSWLVESIQPLVGGNGFTTTWDAVSLHAYERFWQDMLKQQQVRGAQLVVRVTHSSNPDIWDKPEMQESLNLQESFVFEGGKIVRVFIRPAQTPEDTIRAQMEKMLKLKINVFYHADDRDLDSDFLWTDPYLVEWKSSTQQLLRSSVISVPETGKREAIARQWCSIGRSVVAKHPPYERIDPAIAQILRTF
jgi:hypothetical protein